MDEVREQTIERERPSRRRPAQTESTAKHAISTAADVIGRLGVMDLAIPAVRSRIERIDFEGLMDDAFEYVQRNPEVLVVLFGSLTITSGMLVFLAKRTREIEDELPARRNTSTRSARDQDDEEEAPRLSTPPASAKKRGATATSASR